MWEHVQAFAARHENAMTEAGVEIGFMFSTVSRTTILIELVMTWPGPRSIYYDRQIPASKLQRFPDYDDSPEASEFVASLRNELVDLFAEHDGAHLQIGRRYRYFDRLAPETQELMAALKHAVDPQNLMNPGALGLPPQLG